MADHNITQSGATFITERPDRLKEVLAQLDALLSMATGGGFDAFNSLTESHKDNYLGAAAGMARLARDLADGVVDHA